MLTGLRRLVAVRLAFVAVVVALGASTYAVTSAAAATPDSGFAVAGAAPDLVEAGGHVFDWAGAGGAGDDTSVHVYDLSGTQVATIPNEAGWQSFSVSSDGSHVYVGLSAPDVVSVIDTSTLTETARYDVSNLGAPTRVVDVGNRLYIEGYANSSSQIGVITSDQSSGSPSAVVSRNGYPAGFAVRPTTSANTDDVYTSECDFGASCSVDLASFDGTRATELTTVNADDSGKVIWDAADGVVLTRSSKGTVVRDPDTLAARWTVAGDLDSSPSGLLQGRLATTIEEPATGYIDFVVHDLTGATTFTAAPSAPDTRVEPILQANGPTAYAASSAPGTPTRIVSYPYALQQQTAPEAPTNVVATPRAAGHIGLTWHASPVSGNDAPTRYEVRRSTSGGFGPALAVLPPGSTSYDDATAAAGNQYFYEVDAVNSIGSAGSGPANTTTPDYDAPSVQVTTPAAFTLAASLAVSYRATDAISGVANYDARYRTASWNGAFSAYVAPTAWQRRTATTVALTLSPGHEYCVSIRARDQAGNVSTWSADRCSVSPLDDRALRRSARGWTSAADSRAYRATITVSATRNATLTASNARISHIALIATTCSTCGTVSFYLNGHYWRSVSLHAATTHHQVMLLLPPVSRRQTTVTVKNGNGRRVNIDGLGISQT